MTDTTTLAESTEVVASDDCISTGVEGESVVLHTSRGTYYGFNDVGTHVWESIQEPRTVEETCQHVMSRYDVDYEQCLSDVRRLLTELVEIDLVRITND